MADTDWDAVINGLRDQITQLQQVITAQQTQITQGEQAMAQVQTGLNQWGLPASSISRKVQMLNDPGTYTGDRAKFHEWWTKMKVWIRAHETILTLNFDKCTAVWSRMEGPIAGRYTANHMNECTDRGIWPDWGILKDEIEAHFSPQTNVEWSRQELHKLKQGFMRIEDFMNKFVSLKHQGNVSDDFACALLEQAIRPELLREVLLTNCDLSDWDDFSQCVLKVGRNLERLRIIRGGYTPNYSNPAGGSRLSATGTQPGADAPMNISAAQQQQRAGNPQCYNCQQFGHIARNCRNKKVPRGQTPQTARVAEIPAHQAAGPSNDERIRALQGMDFEAMKAYFADLKG